MALNADYRGRVDSAVGSNVATSGPIPVVAGDIFVVAVIADSYQENTLGHVVVSTSAGWGFNVRADNAFFADSNSGAYAGVFAAIPVPTSGAPTITVTTSSAGPTTRRRPSFEMWTITGFDPAAAFVAANDLDLWGNPLNLTLTGAGRTLAIIAAADGYKSGAPYVSGDGITPGPGWDQPGVTGISGFTTAAKWPGAAGSHWMTIDPPGGGSCPYAFASLEFRAAPDPPTVNAREDRTVERGLGIIRTALETEHGTPVTSRQWRLMSGPAGSGAPIDLAAYGGDPTKCLLPSAVLGAHVIRYTAGSAAGPGFDEATITVVLRRPSVNAGADIAQPMGVIDRIATENDYGTAITAREWTVAAGSPSLVGTVLPSTPPGSATLSWTPPTLGRWVLSYTATSAAGTSDPDTCVITVGVTGVPLHLGRTPEPRFAVAVAFGGNLADPDGSDWVFTEVTTDVRIAQGVYIRHGRGDEASVSQPAQMRLTLDNRSGRYSLGGRSPYWPNVRQGTPVQVSCNLTGAPADWKTIFTGYADGWTPVYTTRPTRTGVQVTGDSAVSLIASGTLRRMSQGQPPVASPMRRGLTVSTGVVAYWPCEDGEGARYLASALPGHPGMDFSGRWHDGSNPGLPAATPRLAASDVFVCSGSLPLVSDSEWYGVVPDHSATNVIQLRFLIDVPAAGSNDSFVIIGVITTGDPSFWELRYKLGTNKTGVINVRAWRNFTGPPVKDDDWDFSINGKHGQMGLTLTQNGTAVDYLVDLLQVGAPAAGIVTGSIAGSTVGRATRVQTATDGGHMDVTLGHIVVRNVARSPSENIKHLNAWTGEIVGERLLRLTQENVLWYVQLDPLPPYYPTVTDTMGPQPVGTVLDLFRDCEKTDQGILWDGIGPGLTYTTKRYRESRPPALTLDAALGEVGLPFTPAHDDAYRVNRAVATRHGGASGLFEDVTGPLGSGIVGRYEDSQAYGCRDDSALAQYAGWMVGQGTVEGYRYPRLSLNLTAHPELLDEWLTTLDPLTGKTRMVVPGDRVDVVNLSTIHPAAPVETLRLAVEGYEQTITPFTWDVVMNTSLYRRWAVAQVAAETTGGSGDPRAEFVARVETDGTKIATLTAAGQTTLTVTVTAGPFWTTNPDDYPLTLDVGAVSVRATACTEHVGAQQTFTIDPMPVTRPAEVRVTLWNAPVYGL